MSEEKVSIGFTRYRTPDGEPTCALDFRAGIACPYFRVAGMFGQRETCLFAPEGKILFRGGTDSLGYLIPGDWCPLWTEADNE